VYKLLLLSVLKFSPKVVIFFKDLCAVSKSSSRFSDRGVFACDRKQKKTREEVVRYSSFSSSSLTSSSYSYCALSFSRVFWSNFSSYKRRETPKNGSSQKSVLREFLYVRLLYIITSFWMCDDDYDECDVCSVPSSYRQLGGRGQLLSRRYCKHSVWSFSCAPRTAK